MLLAHGLVISTQSQHPPPVRSDAIIVGHRTRRSRRQMLSDVMLSVLPVFTPGSSSAAATPHAIDLDSIDWSISKSRGLNSERMADGINDSIKETSWVITGMGRPEFFSDSFIFRHEQDRIKMKGYEQYCRLINHKYESNMMLCDLVCCSVTAPNEISALWRFEYTTNRSKIKSSVMLSIFTTSDADDGLVVSQLDKVLVNNFAPSVEDLRARCNWYSCTLRDGN